MPKAKTAIDRYDAVKKECPDAIVLVRTGDFHETFRKDARTASKALGLTVTQMYAGDDPIAMCGFPHSQLEAHLKALVRLGHRVAVAD